MKKNYIGTLDLNNGGVFVGSATIESCALQIVNMPKGGYHCYTYENYEDGGDGRKYIGIEYGGSLDKTNDFEELGKVSILKYGGIFDHKYYQTYKGLVGGQKNEEQLNLLAKKWVSKMEETEETPVKLIDNRGMFFTTNNNDKAQDAVVYVRRDKRQVVIEVKIGYYFEISDSLPEAVTELASETPYECEEWEDECIEERCNEEDYNGRCEHFEEVECDEEVVSCEDFEEVECDEEVVNCGHCCQEYFSRVASNVSSEVEEVCEQEFTYDERKHKIEKLYFSLYGTTIGELVIPNFNEVVKTLIGQYPGLHWYRGMTVEKLDGKIHKIVIDFD